MALILPETATATQLLNTCIIFLLITVSFVEPQPYRLSRKITLSANAPDSIFEVKSFNDFHKCTEQCKANRQCIFVNYHVHRKVCYKTINTGSEKTYAAVEETKQSGFTYWERDSRNRIGPETTTIPPTTVVSETTTLDQTTQTTILQTEHAQPTSTVLEPGVSTTPVSDLTTPTTVLQKDPGQATSTMFGTGVSTTPSVSGLTAQKTVLQTGKTEGTTVTSKTVSESTPGTLPNDPSTRPTTPHTWSGLCTPITTTINPDSASTETSDRTIISPQTTLLETSIQSTTTADGVGTTTYETSSVDETPETTLCERNPDHEYCEVFCRPPQTFKSIQLKGNMLTVGSRQAYVCYDQNTQTWNKHIMICMANGTWTNEDNVCSYRYPVQEMGKQMMYKIVPASVRVDEAYRRCKDGGAKLLKVRSHALFTKLQEKFNRPGLYWTDAILKDDWVTSDGEEVVNGPPAWDVLSVRAIAYLFFKMECAIVNSNFKIQPVLCRRSADFICEMVM